MRYILIIALLSMLMVCCKQTENNQMKQAVSTVEHKDSTIFDKYESWLSEVNTIKPKKLYLDILKKIHEALPKDSCQVSALESLADKEEFKKAMTEFKLLPYEDKFIFIRGFNCWTSRGIGTIYTLIDKNDSLISFKYDCLTDEIYPGGGRIDSIYLNDWNKNGSPDLILHLYQRIAGWWSMDMEIYDLKMTKEPFDLLFSYRMVGFSKTGMDRIHLTWKDSVQVISPFLVEKIALDSTIVEEIKEEDYDDGDKKYAKERYQSKVNAQNEMLKEFSKRGRLLNSMTKTLFKFDKKQKKFIVTH